MGAPTSGSVTPTCRRRARAATSPISRSPSSRCARRSPSSRSTRDAARHLAFVLYSRHDFEGAAREAQRALAINERDAHAWGVLGDARLEVGRYDDGAGGLRADAAAQPGSPRAGPARRLEESRGRRGGRVGRPRARAIAEGRAAGRPRESVAWAQWQLGNEHFSVGDLAPRRGELRGGPRHLSRVPPGRRRPRPGARGAGTAGRGGRALPASRWP